jgi:hypothetical protein
MQIPNADQATISFEKLAKYLLNVDHPDGGGKAQLLHKIGFRAERHVELEQAIRKQLQHGARPRRPSPFGIKYEIETPLEGPHGLLNTCVNLDRITWPIYSAISDTCAGDKTMSVELYSRAILCRDVSEAGLRRGDIGTVVEIYSDSSGNIVGYELELFSAAGETIAVESVPANAIWQPTNTDRLATRVA